MYTEWSWSPWLQVVFSGRVDTFALARQVFRRSSHGALAAGAESTWTGGEVAAGTLRRMARARVPRSETARRRLEFDLMAKLTSAPKTCLGFPTVKVNDMARAILPGRGCAAPRRMGEELLAHEQKSGETNSRLVVIERPHPALPFGQSRPSRVAGGRDVSAARDCWASPPPEPPRGPGAFPRPRSDTGRVPHQWCSRSGSRARRSPAPPTTTTRAEAASRIRIAALRSQ